MVVGGGGGETEKAGRRSVGPRRLSKLRPFRPSARHMIAATALAGAVGLAKRELMSALINRGASQDARWRVS